MPLYEYKCPGCGKKFELLYEIWEVREMSDIPEVGPHCDVCGAILDRKMSISNFKIGVGQEKKS